MGNNQNSNRPSFSTSWLPRVRWNILDMIGVVGKGTVPTYFFLEIDMTWAENLRAQFAKFGHKVTYTALLLKAIGIAQREHPETRTVLLPFGRTVTFNNIVAGFTVERFYGKQPALFFGAIDSPDTKAVSLISNELKAHAEKEFSQVTQLDLQDRFTKFPWLLRQLFLFIGLRNPAFRLQCLGATFGLSSLGKFGLSAMIPPCVTTSTFGIGAVEARPVVKEGAVVVRKMMTLTLNFDHRLLDGAPAAKFLNDIQRLMEGELEKYVQEELRELQSMATDISNNLTDTIDAVSERIAMNTGSMPTLDPSS